ncbi:MAG: hypothetical protein A2Y21_03815 [Clostridiales bacterium GWC2_40_7]|nr:MAG: hypothetical protein A2Y21_03815 [Clostridiales bacterium GWC2_40_7]
MKINKYLKLKKYLNRIYLLVIAALLLLVTVFSITIYYNIEKIVLKNESKNNKNLLYQLKYNIDYMEEVVSNFCQYIYYHPDTQVIMFYKGIDNEYPYIMKNMARIQDIANMTYFLKSIYVYNNYEKVFYSTDNGIFTDNTVFNDVTGSYKEIPRMKLIMRKITPSEKSGNDQNRYVFSYFMYDNLDKSKNMDGGVIFNIKPEWIFNNIKMLNTTDLVNHDKFLILNNDTGELIEVDPSDSSFRKGLKDDYSLHIKKSENGNKAFDFFTCRINGNDFLVTYVKVEKSNWVILKTQPYNEILGYINLLKKNIIFITLIFLGLAVIVALSISQGIYRPIGKLVKKVGSSTFQKIAAYNSNDEISYLDEVYKYSLEQMNLFTEEKNTNREILKNYFLRKLIIDSTSILQEEMNKECKDNGILLELSKQFIVLVIKIDNYHDFKQEYSNKNRDLLKFAVINIMSELILEKFTCGAVDMKEDQIVFILNVDSKAEDVYEDMQRLIKKAQEYIFQYYTLSISVSISEIVDDIRLLTKFYNQTLENSVYRFIFGKMCIIKPEIVKENVESGKVDYSTLLKKKLSEELKCGNIQGVENTVLSILKEISKCNYNNMMICLIQLISEIKNIFEELNQMKLETASFNLNLIIRQIYEAETIDELLIKIMAVIGESLNRDKSSGNEKYIIIVETVKNIIDKNYADGKLCLQEIAPILKVSAPYIGRIFKDITQMSVAEYINEVRLNKAIELMRRSKASINQIIGKVGIENETYFYKIFKKRYGTTPKEYILKYAVSGS